MEQDKPRYRRPRFKVGERVWVKSKGQYATVTMCNFPGYDVHGNPIDDETGLPRDNSNDLPWDAPYDT